MDFTSLAFSPLGRTNEIVRYSSVYQESGESLSEHICDVSMMSYLIVRDIEKKTEGREIFNIGSLLEKCLLHDIDEVITGDIPRNTKYATHKVREDLNKVADSAVRTIEDLVGLEIYKTWRYSKLGKEGFILKICDMLVVVKKSIVEVELRGNLSFLRVVSELERHLTKMLEEMSSEEYIKLFDTEESLVYLKDLVGQAKDQVTSRKVRYDHIIKKYMIDENVIEVKY